MKRLGMFLLICTVLCACSACKKENRSAQELTTRQATNAEAEQTISGLSVRVPATQYRLVRTEPELMDFGERLLPYDAGVVLTGAIFAQGEEGKASEAAAFYAPDRSCVVQPLPVSLDGRLVQTALNGEQVFSLEASAQQDQPRWVLRGPNMQSSLDAALTGCSNITAMMIRDDTAYLAVETPGSLPVFWTGHFYGSRKHPQSIAFSPQRMAACSRGHGRSRRFICWKTI